MPTATACSRKRCVDAAFIAMGAIFAAHNWVRRRSQFSSDPGPGVCPACGSERLEYLQGYFETGVTGPNGEAEMYWHEAVRCRDCGETEEL